MQVEFNSSPVDGNHRVLITMDFYDMAARKEALHQQIHDAIKAEVDDFSAKLTSDICMAIGKMKQAYDDELKYQRTLEAKERAANPKSEGES